MAVFKRDNSPYWIIQFQFRKKTYIKSSKTKDKKVAERMEVEWRAQLHGQTFFNEKEPITLKEMFNKYFKQPVSASTIRNARYLMKRVERDIDLDQYAHEWNQNEWNKWIEKQRAKGNKESSLQTDCLYFRGVWHRANSEAYNIPELKIETPKKGKSRNLYVTPEEKENLFAFLDARDEKWSPNPGEIRDCFTILFETGLRHNEFVRLKWTDVDLKNRTIEIWRKKNEVASYIHMTNALHEMLQRRSDDKADPVWVFPGRDGNHRSDDTGFLNETLKKAGIPKTVHMIRHGYITHLLKNGLTLFEASKLAGHKTPQTTAMIYGHLEVGDVSKKAVAMMNEQAAQSRRDRIKAVANE